jgi:L-2-hydroxyglutarate oxidase LhgO
MTTGDFLVIGGGVIDLSSARELRKRRPDASIVLIEKETACGAHASGRNNRAFAPAWNANAVRG